MIAELRTDPAYATFLAQSWPTDDEPEPWAPSIPSATDLLEIAGALSLSCLSPDPMRPAA